MIHFRWLGHLSTINVMPGLVKLKPATWKGIAERCETDEPRWPSHSLIVRGEAPDKLSKQSFIDDVPLVDWPEYANWTSMRRLIAAARQMAANDPVAAPFLDMEAAPSRAMLTATPKNSTMLWHNDSGAYHDAHLRFHLPLITNPAAYSYIGPEMVHMQVGSLWWFNNKPTHCSCNWGDTMRIHLIFEIRKKVKKAADAGDL